VRLSTTLVRRHLHRADTEQPRAEGFDEAELTAEQVESHTRTNQLRWLHRKHGSCSAEAMAAFDKMLEGGVADIFQLNMMLHEAMNQSDLQHALIKRASSAGLQLNAGCYNRLLTSMLIEGRPMTEVMAALREMEQRGVAWDQRTSRLMEESSDERFGRMRTAELRRLLEHSLISPGGAAAHEQARRLFDAWIERDVAAPQQLTVMLSCGCATSEEQRSLLERLKAAGAQLTASAFNTVLARMAVEGRPDADTRLVLREMEAADIGASEHTHQILERGEGALSKLRTAELQRLAGVGQYQVAWRLVDGLLGQGLLDRHQVRAVLMSVCKSGSERRELLERAVAAGVELDTSCYNLVLSQLQIEGCAEELHKLLAEMTARGVEPDRHTERVQRRTVGHLASIRTTELKKLIDAGSLERAWELFDGLLERGQADSGHFQLMMNQACADYASKQALRRRAVEAGWHPTQMSGRAMPGAPETGGER
jgi:pentatricopeptide repeat protein